MEWGLWSKGTQIQGVGQGKVETQKQDQTGGKTQGNMPGKRDGRTERDPESPRDSHQGGGQGGSWAFRRGTEREQETYSDTEVPEAKSEVLPDSRSTSGTWRTLQDGGGRRWSPGKIWAGGREGGGPRHPGQSAEMGRSSSEQCQTDTGPARPVEGAEWGSPKNKRKGCGCLSGQGNS